MLYTDFMVITSYLNKIRVIISANELIGPIIYTYI